LVLNPQDRVMGMNLAAANLIGRTTAKALGKPVREVFDAQPALLERLATMSESRQEMEIVQNNTPLILELRCSPIRLKTGDKIGRLILLRDVTAVRQAEARTMAATLEQAKMRMVSDFIAASSHDLRTPLSIIATSVYLLRKIDNPDDRAQRLDIVEQQTWRLTRMIEQLHELVKLSQDFKIEVTSVQPGNLRKSLPPLLTELAAKKHIALNWNLPDDAHPIPGDAALILSAFQKILHNALVYTSEGGTVTIRSFMRDNHVVIEVEDDGIGIAPEHQPFIFEAFYKGDKARTGNESGVGLGLAMVSKIMDMHRGQVTFTTVQGQGSVFCLAFPVTLEVLSHR
ncbi:MAG: PAS domain-containing sensor histidine kinase, partial [Anaerolineae bacterium]|nr:PAS domain-containing sensor histidine kinase [Anaerolineae bacterium]